MNMVRHELCQIVICLDLPFTKSSIIGRLESELIFIHYFKFNGFLFLLGLLLPYNITTGFSY